MIKLSIKERREQFLFLVGIFLFTVSVLGFGLFHDSGDEKTISKRELTDELAQDAEFETVVKVQRATIDTAYRQIINFDPAVKAVFLENDINYTLGSIKSNFDRKAFDPRYKTFLQISLLYNALFFNRRELKGNINDIENLKKSLEDCKLSTRQLKETIGSDGARSTAQNGTYHYARSGPYIVRLTIDGDLRVQLSAEMTVFEQLNNDYKSDLYLNLQSI